MDLSQEDTHEQFTEAGTTAWTTVYDSWHESSTANGGIYCAFSPLTHREAAVQDPGWGIMKGDFRPGFSQHYEDDQLVTTYLPGTRSDHFEPLVLSREFGGIVPSSLELTEQFRLYHNLYWNELSSQYMKPQDDGTSSPAVKVSERKIEVRTQLLRQYQAAQQLDLLLFIDSVRYGAEDEVPPPEASWSTDLLRASRYPSNERGLSDRPFTRYLGTKVLPPPPIEKAGIWPFEEVDDHYPEFIIGTDADGDEERFTCNPDALANYFGANPEAPHYLTPVHFRRDVLQKYYEKPELYSVSDGRLTCAGLWSVQIDNSAPETVVVFLGDLGRDLPKSERDYWRSFNITPDAPVSETLIRRALLGQFADPEATDLLVRSSYIALRKLWHDSFGWDLFREPEEADAGLLQRLRLPLNESQAEFEASVRIMTQLFVDAINEAKIKELTTDPEKGEAGISKLKRWLEQESYLHAQRDIQFLRNLQEVRSKATAHRKSSDYEKMLTKVFGKLRGTAAIKTFFESALQMLTGLEEWAVQQRSNQAADPDA